MNLQECANIGFKEAKVKYPFNVKELVHVDKTKYCKFHKCNGYDTDKGIHLKNANENLIKKKDVIDTPKDKPKERKIIGIYILHEKSTLWRKSLRRKCSPC